MTSTAPLQFLILLVTSWLRRHQGEAIEYLRAENRVLRARLGHNRLRFTDSERRLLAEKGRPLGRKRLAEIASLATPETILRWYRARVAAKYDGSRTRGTPGRPSARGDKVEQLLTMARENPSWGYTRLRGALKNLGLDAGNGAGCIVTSPPNQHVYASADPTLANGLGALTPQHTPFSAAWTPPAPAGNVVTPVAPPTWPSFGGNAQIKASFQTPMSWAAIGVKPGLPAQQLGANINVPYLTACDPNGKYLGQVLYPYRVGQTGFGSYQVLSYTAPSGSTIGYVIFSTQNQTQNNNPTWAEFDDLAYF